MLKHCAKMKGEITATVKAPPRQLCARACLRPKISQNSAVGCKLARDRLSGGLHQGSTAVRKQELTAKAARIASRTKTLYLVINLFSLPFPFCYYTRNTLRDARSIGRSDTRIIFLSRPIFFCRLDHKTPGWWHVIKIKIHFCSPTLAKKESVRGLSV